MLQLSHIINKGATRLCLYHPERADVCVKVSIERGGSQALYRDLAAYEALLPQIGDYLPGYERELVKTNLGLGLVCELIMDDDGKPSPSLLMCCTAGKLTPEIAAEVRKFCANCVEKNIPLYDMNLKNFMLQTKGGKTRLLFVDLKCYNRYKGWCFLHLERVVPALSRIVLKRRSARAIALMEKYL